MEHLCSARPGQSVGARGRGVRPSHTARRAGTKRSAASQVLRGTLRAVIRLPAHQLEHGEPALIVGAPPRRNEAKWAGALVRRDSELRQAEAKFEIGVRVPGGSAARSPAHARV